MIETERLPIASLMLTKRQNTPTKVLMRSEIGNTRITAYLPYSDIDLPIILKQPLATSGKNYRQALLPSSQNSISNMAIRLKLDSINAKRSFHPS